MKKEIDCVLAINHLLAECKNDSRKTQLVRDYLKHKIGKLMKVSKQKKTRHFYFLGIPINLIGF